MVVGLTRVKPSLFETGLTPMALMWTLCVRAANILAFPSRSLHGAAEGFRQTAETQEGFFSPPHVLSQNRSLLLFGETSVYT